MLEENIICCLQEVSIFLFIILNIYFNSNDNYIFLCNMRPVYPGFGKFIEISVIHYFILLTFPQLQPLLDIRNVPTYTIIILSKNRNIEYIKSICHTKKKDVCASLDTEFMTTESKKIFKQIYDTEYNKYDIKRIHLYSLDNEVLLINCHMQITQMDNIRYNDYVLSELTEEIKTKILIYKNIYVIGDYNKYKSVISKHFDENIKVPIEKQLNSPIIIKYYFLCENQINQRGCIDGIIHISNPSIKQNSTFLTKYIKYKSKYLITKNNKLR
jgi:hypothetical protein